MRKIVGRIYDDENDDMVDAVVEVDRTDDNEVAVNVHPLRGDGGPTLYFDLYEAQELVNALNLERLAE